MYEDLLAKVRDVKTVCMDRLDSITANGAILKELFETLEEVLEASIAMEQKKKEKK